MRVAHRFTRLLDAYRRPDGRRWSGAELAKVKDGVVNRSYVTNLRKGRIGSPGHDKMAAIAEEMGFPPALWFDDAAEGSNADLDVGLAAALRDETARAIARESHRLSDRERKIVLGIVRQLADSTQDDQTA
jgi:transcriptional regulator with XRE-family HTH domain